MAVGTCAIRRRHSASRPVVSAPSTFVSRSVVKSRPPGSLSPAAAFLGARAPLRRRRASVNVRPPVARAAVDVAAQTTHGGAQFVEGRHQFPRVYSAARASRSGNRTARRDLPGVRAQTTVLARHNAVPIGSPALKQVLVELLRELDGARLGDRRERPDEGGRARLHEQRSKAVDQPADAGGLARRSARVAENEGLRYLAISSSVRARSAQ